LKLHVFPSLEICDGDTGPHSHSTEVMSLVFAGTVRNTVYDFSPDEDGDIQAERFQGPAHLSRKVVPVGLGRLSMVSDQEVSGNVYRVAHGEIHTSQTIGDYAVTLCFFGRPKEVPGTRYEPRGVVEQPEDRRSMLLRPKDIIS
jgi:hypothetical protein